MVGVFFLMGILLQALGGGVASQAVLKSKSPATGSHIMLIGIIMFVFARSLNYEDTDKHLGFRS